MSRPAPATLKDVAALANVSLKTASRVLNDDPKVAAKTRESVKRAMADLDYFPDPAARSLRAGRDRTVGVVVDSIGDVFFAELVAAIEAELEAGGYSSLIASSHRQPERERETVQRLVQRRCAGIIVSPSAEDSLEGARISDVPVVFVDRVGNVPGSVSVVSDDVGLARTATQHLIEHGHERIALISDTIQVETTRHRHEGYRLAMDAAGLPVIDELVKTDCSGSSDAMRALEQLLGLEQAPTAIFCTNARLSLGVVPALHQFDRTDLALISYGDFMMAESLSPAVSVIDHSPQAMGQAAARALLDLLAARSSADLAPVLQVPARLVERGSGELRPHPATATVVV